MTPTTERSILTAVALALPAIFHAVPQLAPYAEIATAIGSVLFGKANFEKPGSMAVTSEQRASLAPPKG